MTWNQLFEELCLQCSCDALAANIVGRLMDDYESWDWDASVPGTALEVLK